MRHSPPPFLVLQTNLTTAALGAANIALYAGVYTPLKQVGAGRLAVLVRGSKDRAAAAWTCPDGTLMALPALACPASWRQSSLALPALASPAPRHQSSLAEPAPPWTAVCHRRSAYSTPGWARWWARCRRSWAGPPPQGGLTRGQVGTAGNKCGRWREGKYANSRRVWMGPAVSTEVCCACLACTPPLPRPCPPPRRPPQPSWAPACTSGRCRTSWHWRGCARQTTQVRGD